MKIGIGYENDSNAYDAGEKVALSALKKGRIQDPTFALAFCHGTMDHSAFFEGLRSVIGDAAPIFGGSAAGVITNDQLCYEGAPSGVAILSSPELACRYAWAGGLDQNEEATGNAIGRQITPASNDFLSLLFYDSVKTPPTENSPPMMNASRPLIKGIKETLQSKAPILGAGVIGGFDFGATEQFCGHHVGCQEAVGAMLSGDFTVYYSVMHGCTLQDGIYHTITAMEGAKIFELDDRPIVSVIDELYGSQEWQQQQPLKRLTIGVDHGDPFGDFEEAHYVNRLITGILPNRDGVMIFEPDLEVGTRIQFMLRDSQEMILSARQNTEKLVAQILSDGKQPVFATYIDCAGRTASFSDTITEEASELVTILNRHQIPLFGFYTGVEIAPMLGESQGLDWTGVLIVLAR